MRKYRLLLLRLLFMTVIIGCSSESCNTEDDFSCTDGKRCISKNKVCNDYPNCLDESDEDPELCKDWDYDYDYDDYDGGFFSFFGNEQENEKENEKEGKDEKNKIKKDESDFKKSVKKTKSTLDEKTPSDRCSTTECSANGVLSFLSNNVYQFLYDLTVETHVVSGTDQKSTLALSADVDLMVFSACEMQLTIRNIKTNTSSPDSLGYPDESVDIAGLEARLAEYPIRFSMQDGLISTVCPSKKENGKILNFKRGIISLLQNSMPFLHLTHKITEKDVVGECPVTYQFLDGKDTSVLIKKTRDEALCHGKSFFHSTAKSVDYKFKGGVERLPLMDAESTCQQEIRDGLIEESTCEHQHTLIPFRSEHGHINSIVKQTLRKKRIKYHFEEMGAIERRTDITYNHLDSIHSDELFDSNSHVEQATLILDITAESDDLAWKHGGKAAMYAKLIYSLRRFTASELTRILQEREWTEKDKSLFLDAIPMVGTEPCVSFMVKEIRKNFQPKLHLQWIRSISQIQSPDVPSIKAASKLLLVPKLPTSAFLHVGAAIHSYCSEYIWCALNKEIQDVMKIFEDSISDKKGTQNDNNRVLMALKGIGNAGLAANRKLTEALHIWFSDKKVKPEIRVAAMSAFRRIKCDFSRHQFPNVLHDTFEDSEIRISAYLEIMRCPTYDTLKLIHQVLENEEVNQVGSFIWSHLKNIEDSGMPSKAILQALLSNQEFKEKFRNDVTKFSKNIEWSAFYDAYNVGGSMESNIIFSEKSYLPRSASMNLTADLFGKSFNFFEMGVRLDGMEKYLQNMMLGRPIDQNPIRDDQAISNEAIRRLALQSSRPEDFRNTKAEMSLFVKLFGNDVRYETFDGIEEIMDVLKKVNPMNFLEELRNGKEVNVQRSRMPIGVKYFVATSAGISLAVSLDGAVSLDVSAQGQADLQELFFTRSGALRGKIMPRLDVDMRGSMVSDIFSLHTGCEIEAKLHSSIATEATLTINGSRLINFHMNLPQETVEMVDLSAKLVLIHEKKNPNVQNPEKYRELIGAKDSSPTETSTCSPFEEELGIKLCWNLQLPDVSKGIFDHKILMFGPVHFMAALRKSEGLQSYKFSYQWENDIDHLKFLLFFDTPNTAVSREHSVDFRVNYHSNDGYFKVKTPRKLINTKGKYIWSDNEKRLDATIQVDETRGSVTLGYTLANKATQSTLIPNFNFFWNKQEIITVSGTLQSHRRETHKSQEEGSLYYSVDLRYIANLQERSTGKIGGYINVKPNYWKISLDIPYYPDEKSKEEKIQLEYVKIYKTIPFKKIERNWKIEFTQFKNLNCQGRLASKQSYGLIENDLQVGFGREYKNPEHQVSIFQNLLFFGETDRTTFNATMAIKYPKHELDLRAGADLFVDEKDTSVGLVFQYATDKQMNTRFHLIRSSINPLDVQCDFNLFVPSWTDLKLNIKLMEIRTKVYEFDVAASISEKNRVELGGVYSDLSSPLNHLHNLELKVKVPQKEIIFVNTTVLHNSREMALLVQLIWTSGRSYKCRLAYITEKDDLSVLENRIEVDFRLPKQLYYWHLHYTVGEFITISNEIHIDRYRDLSLWLRMPQNRKEYASVELKFFWDANRDPYKKLSANLDITDRLFTFTTSITIFGQEYVSGWTSSKNVTYTELESSYDYSHKGHLTWKDHRKVLHELTTGVTFYLRRGADAELRSHAYLTTPFSEWRNNSALIEYARGPDHILASLISNWHYDEFIHMRLDSSKSFGIDSWKIGNVLDISSSLNGLVTLRTKFLAERAPGSLQTETFVQWEDDKMDFILEAEDHSGLDSFQLGVAAKGTTTLPGFKTLDAYFDFLTQDRLTDVYGKLTWDDAVYKLKAKGELFSGRDHMKTEFLITTPEYENGLVALSIKIFEDVLAKSEKIQAKGTWYHDSTSLEGELASEAEDFRASLKLETTLEDLAQFLIKLHHQVKENQATGARIQWNHDNNLGFESLSHFNSLTDFLLQVTVMTPFEEYKELSAELTNLFTLNPRVNVNSKVLARINDKKFGVGGRLQQGKSPRLWVGLQLHIPSPDLEELYFDIGDNSTLEYRNFFVKIGHGQKQDFNLNLKMKRTDVSMETFLVASANVSHAATEYQSVSLDSAVKIYWMTSRDVDVRLKANTVSKSYQLDTKASIFPNGGGKIDGHFDFPYESVRDIAFEGSYLLVPYPRDGYVEAKLYQRSQKIFMASVKGNVRKLSLDFVLPLKALRTASLEYTMTAQDIAKSFWKASGSVNDEKLSGTADVILDNENYIIKMAGNIDTKAGGLQEARIAVFGHREGDKFLNQFEIRNDRVSYDIATTFKFEGVQDWDVLFVLSDPTNTQKILSGQLLFQDVLTKPMQLAFALETVKDSYSMKLEIGSEALPYESHLSWTFPNGAGELRVLLISLTDEKVSSVTYLRTEIPENPKKEFTLSFDLLDQNPNQEVDVDVKLEFVTRIDEEESTIILDGKLRQVTADPGRILLSLTWPGMDPVVLEAMASYQENSSPGVSTEFKLQLPGYKYGFEGTLDRSGPNLDLTSKIWWQKVLEAKQLVDFKGNFILTKLYVSGKMEIEGPFAKGVQKGTVFYNRGKEATVVKLDMIVLEKLTLIEANYALNEGWATLKSDILWDGNPANAKYNQVVNTEGGNGEYSLEWPEYDSKTEKYSTQVLQAKLNHSYVGGIYKTGHEGVMAVTLPVTRNEPVILTYSLVYPNAEAIEATIGAEFKGQSIQLDGHDTTARTEIYEIRKTGMNVRNRIWPIGGYYLKKSFFHSEEVEDKLTIHELDGGNHQSEVIFEKSSKSDGKRLGVKANLASRKLELSGGYTFNINRFATDALAKWGPEQLISANFDIRDQSQEMVRKNYKVVGFLENFFQKATLDGEYWRTKNELDGSFVYNWNVLDERKSATSFKFELEKDDESDSGIRRQWFFHLYNPVLDKPVIMKGHLIRNREYPILVKSTLSYSVKDVSDLDFDAYLRKSGKHYSSLFSLSHPSSSLFAESSNGVGLSYPIYSFNQNYKYTDKKNVTSSGNTHGEIDISHKTISCQFDTKNRKLAVNFEIPEEEEDIWTVVEKSNNDDSKKKKLNLYSSQPLFIVTFDEHKANETIPEEPEAILELCKQVVMEGGVQDFREAYVMIQHHDHPAEPSWKKDANVFLRLNHSRLLSSEIVWNKKSVEYFENEVAAWMGTEKGIQQGLIDFMTDIVSSFAEESSDRAKPIFEEMVVVLSPLVEDFKNGGYDFYDSFVRTVNTTHFTVEEKQMLAYLEDIYHAAINYINEIDVVQRIKTGAGSTIQKYFLLLLDEAQSSIQYLLENEISAADIKKALQEYMVWFASAYDKVAKEAYYNLRTIVEDFQMKLSVWLQDKWHTIYYNYKPHIMKTVHIIETATHDFFQKISKMTQSLEQSFKSASYMKYMQSIYTDVYQKYKMWSERSLKQNINSVYDFLVGSMLDMSKAFVSKVFPFTEDWLNDIKRTWGKLNKFENVQSVSKFLTDIYDKAVWLWNQIDVREAIIDSTAFLIEHGRTVIHQTATQAQLRHIKAKTWLFWHPEEGRIYFDQKLPFEWFSLNQTPQWKEMFEIPMYGTVKNWFYSKNQPSFLEIWYKHGNINPDPLSWLPPFPGTAYVIGDRHIVTFDGSFLSFDGNCEHLMAVDLISGLWAVTIKRNPQTPKTIHFYLEGKHIEVTSNYKVKIDGKITGVPAQLNQTTIWRTDGTLHLSHIHGLEASWNLVHDVMTLTVSGPNFLNTAGLMGNNNYEGADDRLLPSGEILRTRNSTESESQFINSWAVDAPKCLSTTTEAFPIQKESHVCNQLFNSEMSQLRYCFYHVEPSTYRNICFQDYQGRDEDTCSVSFAYRQKCSQFNIPMKLPTFCVKCEYFNPLTKSMMTFSEGTSITLQKEEVSKTNDIVLLVELGQCNQLMKMNAFNRFIKSLNHALLDNGSHSNRYIIVAYGGKGAYARPTIVSVNSVLFTTAKNLARLLSHLEFDDRDSYIDDGKSFSALTFASNLNFRPSATVNLLMFPCSPCYTTPQLDYSTVYHILKHSDIHLSVFKQGFFDISKKSLKKKIAGYDSTLAYTLKEYRRKKVGKSDILDQIIAPKKELEFCYPLALETEGALYTSEFLRNSKKAEKLGTLVGRRIDESSKEPSDERCLCLSTQEVTPLMRCDRWDKGDFTVLEKYGLDLEAGWHMEEYESKDIAETDFYVN